MADADPQRTLHAGTIDATAEAPVARRRRWRPLLMVSVPLLAAIVAGWFWFTAGRTVSTDNAYVAQDKVAVSADVAGRIVEVGVTENQRVKAGDLLFRIDPAPYRIAVEQADAAIAGAQVQLTSLQSDYRGTGADIVAARDAIQSAKEDYDRQAELMRRGFTTRARLQQAEHALEQARGRLGNAQAEADKAQAKLSTGSAVPGANPAIAAARVGRDKAALDLSRTVVRAPVGGTVSQTDRLQVGQMMITGLPAVSIVASDTSWVEANFKETDLQHMRVGQPAEVRFDAFPGVTLKGHVQSIGAGTGSEFSVLPAQNATGNWVKVTQRIPVRIAIDQKSPRQLIAGQSADVTVDVRSGR
ncbi:HlyD family secretion protein [Sphingomonas sp. KR1UV-12]|uniref:HlyD family secretion protein n=1 Tax=Sphingomonas aurea TaxID=3063994 RepID=A0ABT9EGP4_9SPHN|nr:HlyD family secretion protein [Sphingomonas sp. KR1UV-12]MDP1026141.1 HlyD family secretion protein [Sphingomonas sp. KR1UV-12]